jgi:hypothetical protein
LKGGFGRFFILFNVLSHPNFARPTETALDVFKRKAFNMPMNAVLHKLLRQRAENFGG